MSIDNATTKQLQLADKVFKNLEDVESTCEEIFLFFNKDVSNITKSEFYIEFKRQTTESIVQRYEQDNIDKDTKLGFRKVMTYWEMYNSTESSLKAICDDPTQQGILLSRFKACRKHVERELRKKEDTLAKCLVGLYSQDCFTFVLKSYRIP
jgi:hypothetical protein